MRKCLAVVLVLAATACGNGGSSAGDDVAEADAAVTPTTRGFRVVSPDIDIQPGEEVTKCYFFRTPNTEPMAVNRWTSDMTPGSHHMIMFMTPSEEMPAGTVTPGDCGMGSGTNLPTWTYAAQTALADLKLPSDDGTGKPLAQDVPAGAFAYFQMHYVNATDQVLKAHVTLDAEALEPDVAYTQTAAYVTFNSNISIPAGAVGDVESQTCDVPAGVKFWMMSTHAHKQAVQTRVKDGTSAGTAMFESTDWEHPGAAAFMTPDTFYSFASNKLTYECTYNNPSNRVIKTGNSAVTDEMCMASGYYFPATRPRFCFNNFLVP